MKSDRWTEDTARAIIDRTGGKVGHKTVFHDRAGIKVLGAIDYLVNYKKYTRKREL